MNGDLEKLNARIEAAEQKQADLEKDRQNAIAMGNFRPAGNSVSSDEQRALRYFGCRSPRELVHVNTGDPKFRHVPLDLKMMVVELKSDLDISRMTQQICFGEPRDEAGVSNDRFAHVKGILENSYGKDVLAPKLKSFGSTTATAGDEWVPTAVSSQYIEEYELERQVAARFRNIPMPSDPFHMPIQNSVTTARIQAEGSTITDTNFGTNKIELDAKKLAEFYILPEELNEDSAPNILAIARTEVTEAIMRAIETAIINGDDSGTHQDDDTDGGAANLAEKVWKGLRKKALANSANGSTVDFLGAAVSTAKLRSLRSAMGKFSVNPRELVWKASPKVYLEMLALDEVTTVEKFGPQATILQGALSALDGIPIIQSEFVRDDVAATGVNTSGGPNTFSTIHLTNTRRFYVGTRRPIRVRAVMDPTPPNDRWLLASWWRGDFEGFTQGASEVSAVLGINIA